MITGTIDLLAPQPDLEHVEQVIADEVSDRQLLQGIHNHGQGIDGDQIIINSIESWPDEDGNVVTYFDAGHILNS
jgi:archaellum biogenesis ATPase FlaH